MTLVTVTLPGPSGTPVKLADWGTIMTQDMNEIIAALTAPLAAWAAFTPTWGSTGTAPVLGDGTISGRFMQFGKVGYLNGILTAGGTTTFGTGTYTWSLPAGWTAAGAVGTPVGSARVFDTSATTRFVGSVAVSTGGTVLAVGTHAATTDVSGTVPMTWATGDSIVWEAAIELT